jgi:hypothetical protein
MLTAGDNGQYVSSIIFINICSVISCLKDTIISLSIKGLKNHYSNNSFNNQLFTI